jgi:16S rRNA (cytosine967-C5)-methyltransferase
MTATRQPGTKKSAPRNRLAAISLARKAAFNILIAVERGHSHSDDLLRGKAVDALSAPDRNLATALVLGVLRWQIQLDHLLLPLLKHPNARLDPEVLIALRLGAFQLRHLDRIPDRAAIDESVELAKQAGHRFASGMVNAVLRKLASTPLEDFPEQSAGQIALAQAHPDWMVERWAGFYGMDTTRALCRHGQLQPAFTIRVHDLAIVQDLAAEGIQLQPGNLLTSAFTVISGDVTESAAFREGRLRIQDEGSQLIAELAAACSDPPARLILDCCAAPGNKTLILAQRNLQARILVCESSAQRFTPLQQRLAPLGERIECRLTDAGAIREDSAFELALADVPCSGTGTLGRNPEIRQRLRLEDLARQTERQRSILEAALRALRPGGRVVYSTCSMEPEENQRVVSAVIAEAPTARQVSLEFNIDSLAAKNILIPSGAARLKAALRPEGALRLLPGTFHTDGFFIALVEKTA